MYCVCVFFCVFVLFIYGFIVILKKKTCAAAAKGRKGESDGAREGGREVGGNNRIWLVSMPITKQSGSNKYFVSFRVISLILLYI